MTTWMVRAGHKAAYINDFTDQHCVAIGWHNLGDISPGDSKESIMSLAAEKGFGDGNRHKIATAAGQIWRFLNEIKVGDSIVTYDPGRRLYLLGEVKSEPSYAPQQFELMPRIRQVEWRQEVPRDLLSQSTRNSLGAISTLFKVPEEAASDIAGVASGTKAPVEEVAEEPASVEDLYEQTVDQSRELIKDQINKLDPYELQDLVAGVLRAMGYKTRVSPPGADRGIDIFASPDGFGFEQPRIVVECKHRTNTAMGAPDVRSFLGGRHADDKGLYVSTGGFTKEARYEAERATIPMMLMDLDQLVDAVKEHYENMDSETRVLLPLAKLYWPVG